MPPEPTHKPRPNPTKPYNRKPKDSSKTASLTNQPRTSAKPPVHAANTKENLTLGDWLVVFGWIDAETKRRGGGKVPQREIVEYFKNRREGALIFDQSTLSRNMKNRAALEQRATATTNALSMKRARIVTEPKVERALVEWVRTLNKRGEVVTGPMLLEKRKRFEEMFKVPDERRLPGSGWLPSFCRAYGIKEVRCHGEAGSVDPEAVQKEIKRLQRILASYAPEDIFNFDETGLFPFAPPDRGLAMKQMSGKKKEKFRITLGLGANSDGSEKLPPVFIGRSKNPHCFRDMARSVREKLYYRNNKTAWMTSELFDEWLRILDTKMLSQKRHIILLIDNFPGHYGVYEPRNIQVEFLEPNLTSVIQPMDAGVIRCFKAHYRRDLCRRAIDLDDAGDRDIFKLNLLEGIMIAQRAWDSVTPDTIKHCWEHTKIICDPKASEASGNVGQCPIKANPGAWDILRKFASSDSMTLPEAEKAIEKLLGDQYTPQDWQQAFDAIMSAENDTVAALKAVNKLASVAAAPKLTIRIRRAAVQQTTDVEQDLAACVDTLRSRNRIFQQPLTIDEIVEPTSEYIDPELDPQDVAPGMNDEDLLKTIVDRVEGRVEVIEVEDSEEESDEEEGGHITRAEAIDLVAKVEKVMVNFGGDLKLASSLRAFRRDLVTEMTKNASQSHIDNYFKPSTSHT